MAGTPGGTPVVTPGGIPVGVPAGQFRPSSLVPVSLTPSVTGAMMPFALALVLSPGANCGRRRVVVGEVVNREAARVFVEKSTGHQHVSECLRIDDKTAESVQDFDRNN